MKSHITLFILGMAIMAGFNACTSDSQGGTQGPDRGAPSFTVEKVSYSPITTYREYPAEVEGEQSIELRPRIEGYLAEILVDEGDYVKKGQLLFKINADEYAQSVSSAKASVAVAQANVNTAKMEVEKQTPLVEKGIVGNYTLTNAKLTLESAKASLAQAKANLQTAQTNLSYTYVKSPTNGLVGTFPYRIGSLVSNNSAQPLTVISNIEKVRVYFSVNEKELLSLNRNFVETDAKGDVESSKKVSLVLANGEKFDQEGVIDAISGQIDQSTGSATVRATFNNPRNILRNGSSATIKIPQTWDSSVVVSQNATYEIQNRTFLYAFDEKSETVKPREIAVQPDESGKRFIVTQGLKPGDIIVTEGINALKPDMKITAQYDSKK